MKRNSFEALDVQTLLSTEDAVVHFRSLWRGVWQLPGPKSWTVRTSMRHVDDDDEVQGCDSPRTRPWWETCDDLRHNTRTHCRWRVSTIDRRVHGGVALKRDRQETTAFTIGGCVSRWGWRRRGGALEQPGLPQGQVGPGGCGAERAAHPWKAPQQCGGWIKWWKTFFFFFKDRR